MSESIEIDLSVDWPLLRKQKAALLRKTFDMLRDDPDAVLLEGLIELLDHIQDEAAAYLGEEAVFGNLGEEA